MSSDAPPMTSRLSIWVWLLPILAAGCLGCLVAYCCCIRRPATWFSLSTPATAIDRPRVHAVYCEEHLVVHSDAAGRASIDAYRVVIDQEQLPSAARRVSNSLDASISNSKMAATEP
ncbi:hypothetical protein H257_13529 [Aphanomyces astaci]|uniref:Uncharacterized protein n=1 Tax=Aphanomyces astaci TaxID=112090 RepID=W4FW36_APHAT|nr:hypothetical protein H257_13529 [Aphanomyces astaci]ETV71131.1 hypothetical protein H257_13529 [Aphanomyces astaci]|eukprot:XP_009839377.1 hypothetical protein H257_13529 [Aphanomyces astaci]